MNPNDFKIRASACGQIMSNAKTKGELSQVCKTYLHTWYANDQEQIRSKYIDKGNMVEDELIDFAAVQLGYGILEKNRESRSDEYFSGTCDVVSDDSVIDVKAPFNKKTLHDSIVGGLDKDYEWQLRVYCHLWQKPKGILFYGLMNTPEGLTYLSDEVIYDDMPSNERWVAYNVPHDPSRIEEVIDRVKQCREYLVRYDSIIRSQLGQLI
jgi:hypothetical protein